MTAADDQVDDFDAIDDGDELVLLDERDDRGSDPPPELYYPTLEEFVHVYLAATYRRHIDDGRNRSWCPQWWRHAEAISRLEAMWRSFEHLRLDPTTGTSVWFRDHADPHMAVLLDPDGPFKHCGPEKGHSPRLEPLPVERPPVGMFVPPAV